MSSLVGMFIFVYSFSNITIAIEDVFTVFRGALEIQVEVLGPHSGEFLTLQVVLGVGGVYDVVLGVDHVLGGLGAEHFEASYGSVQEVFVEVD